MIRKRLRVPRFVLDLLGYEGYTSLTALGVPKKLSILIPL
jgi:branched-subunit amino acid transport protein